MIDRILATLPLWLQREIGAAWWMWLVLRPR